MKFVLLQYFLPDTVFRFDFHLKRELIFKCLLCTKRLEVPDRPSYVNSHNNTHFTVEEAETREDFFYFLFFFKGT